MMESILALVEMANVTVFIVPGGELDFFEQSSPLKNGGFLLIMVPFLAGPTRRE